ncbi:MAG: hypothetical protein LBV69_09330 [Bacteroidales bacterium]|jgi:PBP1b-binding outer membrane lipoprotein LpoB|nr:hypothetical protein [Bacteroidales bacterium]
MKKIISVLFAASLMFVIFSCAPKPAETEAPTEEATEQVEEQNVQDEETAPEMEETIETVVAE